MEFGGIYYIRYLRVQKVERYIVLQSHRTHGAGRRSIKGFEPEAELLTCPRHIQIIALVPLRRFLAYKLEHGSIDPGVFFPFVPTVQKSISIAVVELVRRTEEQGAPLAASKDIELELIVLNDSLVGV